MHKVTIECYYEDHTTYDVLELDIDFRGYVRMALSETEVLYVPKTSITRMWVEKA